MEVREEKQQGVECPGHEKVKAAIERHTAMLRQNQTNGNRPCQNGTAKNPQTLWRGKRMGAPPPSRHRHLIPEPTPSPPGTPPVPPGDNEGAQRF